jgi:hypothetical protein
VFLSRAKILVFAPLVKIFFRLGQVEHVAILQAVVNSFVLMCGLGMAAYSRMLYFRKNTGYAEGTCFVGSFRFWFEGKLQATGVKA